VDMEFLSVQPSIGLFPKLKSFKVHEVIIRANEMHFVKFALSKAKHLAKIELFVHDDIYIAHILGIWFLISSDLASYEKACPHVEVVVTR
jgi:hypothetical protein